MKSVDIVCPVYREEMGLQEFYNCVARVIEKHKSEYYFSFIFVIDPSDDSSEEVVTRLANNYNNIKGLLMTRRFGHQAALIAGIDASNADAIIMLDSDLQHPPALISDMLKHWSEGADIVQGLRIDNKKTSFFKKTTSRIFYSTFEYFTGIKIYSGAADYRLISRRVSNVFRDELHEKNPFIRGLIPWVGFKLVYLPFSPDERFAGNSSYSLYSLIHFALNGICSFSKIPLRLSIIIGFIFSFISIVIGIFSVLIYFYNGRMYAPGWSSLILFEAFSVGIILFSLGILGEYLGLIFDEVKARPRYLIDKKIG